ncbi:unnamed protein product [Closterium sp. NIES-53]
MATPRVLRFDGEGRLLEFSVWLLRAHCLLESQVQAHETLWAHASGDLPEPAGPAPLAADPTHADSDRYARERADVTSWKSRDAAACIALSSLLPESEETHFTQDVESDLHSVASASGAVPPPLFGECTVPHLPTFTASLAAAAKDVTAAAVTNSSRSQGRNGRRGSQGVGGGGGGGGGDVASGNGRSAGARGAPRAAAGDFSAVAGGGDTRVCQPPTGLPAAGVGAGAWYLTQRQQHQQQPLPSQQPQQQQRQQ